MARKEQDEIFKEIFSIIAPGQALRNAVDRIKEASLGALIILSNLEEIKEYVEGGFLLDTEFSPQKLYELAKMDGAVIVSSDVKKIYGANLQLRADHNIPTDESGTRHRTAHRLAIQTGHIIITVSERRNKITVFKDNFKYSLDSIGDLLIKSSQAIMSLEKYSSIINNYLNSLDMLEYEKMVTIDEITKVIRFFILLFNMNAKIERYIMELGKEGITLELQRREIMMGHKDNFINIIKDYYNSKEKLEKSEKIFEKLTDIDGANIADDETICKLLAYDLKKHNIDDALFAKGYRLLNNVSNLTKKDIDLIVEKFESINILLDSTLKEFESIKGISKIKAYKVMKMCEKHKKIINLEIL